MILNSESDLLRLLHYPSDLPITDKRESIVQAIREHQVLIITGETGSGKSTQIPKLCLEAGRGVSGLIGCTQPRRIAAITLAARVAEEMREDGRRLVGHKIRFQDKTSRNTRIKFMTDGILLAEAQSDRFFKAYDTLIIDEAHERTLNIDFLLGLIRRVLPRRPDLKVIITSATINPEKFSEAFGNAPIVEVSGRTYPVEVRYRPLSDLEDEEGGDATHLDAAVAAVDELKGRGEGGRRGDILVFMPTESDIRETVQRLEERKYFNTIVLPLFGRLSAGDQQRVFRTGVEEKIVVATNVAETSITIPRIKYVIDTGLARISQYNARSRTQGLPVAPISRASADQRKGRCGRVAAGICIRLYSEEEYLNRPLYTLPEIQRSNLAEVILRMLMLRLGNIQDFPFLDPPSPASIKDGFGVLQELSAVDEHRKLTALGRTMARLPLDPRISRMLLHAQREGALTEMAILAAALSSQDPRERPLDQETQADQAHAPFRDRRSDFVSLLKIWGACFQTPFSLSCEKEAEPPDGSECPPLPVEGELAGSSVPRSQSQLRKFCRSRFLSYRRLREWRDIHEEILDILKEIGGFEPNLQPASYEAIHRSVVSGYLSHIALRKEKNIYTAAKNRLVMIFPGSGLFNRGGAWVTAAELVQTSRLFARTAANIDPAWLEELGSHLCRSSYSEPHWEKNRGQVVAFERVTLYGLSVVERRKVNYGRIRPDEAREIFIRQALIEGDLPRKYGFLEHNKKLISTIEDLESKTRRRDLLVEDEALYRFYDSRLPQISDSRSFDRLLKESGGDGDFRMSKADLLKIDPDLEALEQFPDRLTAGGMELPLKYAFSPGEENDGVTAIIPVHSLPGLPSEPFEWLVPGLLEERITILLKGLPKSVRKQLVPVGDTVQRVLECIPFGEGRFGPQLSRCVEEVASVRVAPEDWDQGSLPSHLKMRFEIVGNDGKVLGSGRDIESLRALAIGRHDDDLWSKARKEWEREGLTRWDFGDVPPRIELGRDAMGVQRIAYPGLVAQGGAVALRLFNDPAKACEESRKGLLLLYELTLGQELKGLKRVWVFPDSMAGLIFFMGSRSEASRMLQKYLLREMFGLHEPRQPEEARFEESVQRLRGMLGALGQEMIQEVFDVLRGRDETRFTIERFRKMSAPNPGLARLLQTLHNELDELVPPQFLDLYRRDEVAQLPRFLKALQVRVERAYASPDKDRLKAEQVLLYAGRYEEIKRELDPSGDAGFIGCGTAREESRRLLQELRWALEEFKISVFAPEIKTRTRVSAKRLEEKLWKWEAWKSARP